MWEIEKRCKTARKGPLRIEKLWTIISCSTHKEAAPARRTLGGGCAARQHAFQTTMNHSVLPLGAWCAWRAMRAGHLRAFLVKPRSMSVKSQRASPCGQTPARPVKRPASVKGQRGTQNRGALRARPVEQLAPV